MQPPAGTDPDRPDARLLLWAYRHGIFPMAEPGGPIDWFSPRWRGVIPLDRFHVPATLRRLVRQGRFEIRSDTCFAEVMRACAAPRRQEPSSWIDDRLIDAYGELHARGHAHSVEAWRDGHLVGGLYGVHIGAAFFGESMFHRADLGGSGASKVCLVHLVERMRRQGFTLLDTQFQNDHLDQFGCVEITARQYMRRLADAIDQPVIWS